MIPTRPDGTFSSRLAGKLAYGRDTPNSIRQRGAIFRFSLTYNFDPGLGFSNIQKRINILSYLVYISFKISVHWLFY
jgi:hypothetical protein